MKQECSCQDSELNDFSSALKDAFLFKDSYDRKIYSHADSLAMKYWKFLYTVVKWGFVVLFYCGIAFLFVLCLGAWGSVYFFGGTILLFTVYYFLFDQSAGDLTLI